MVLLYPAVAPSHSRPPHWPAYLPVDLNPPKPGHLPDILISGHDTKDLVDLVIKVFFKGIHPSFPLEGKMSHYLENKKVRDITE